VKYETGMQSQIEIHAFFAATSCIIAGGEPVPEV
jgi:hypothetical protein